MPHFKMEGVYTLKNLLQLADWLAKVDLKDVYFSMPYTQTKGSTCASQGETSLTSSPAIHSAWPQCQGCLPRH